MITYIKLKTKIIFNITVRYYLLIDLLYILVVIIKLNIIIII